MIHLAVLHDRKNFEQIHSKDSFRYLPCGMIQGNLSKFTPMMRSALRRMTKDVIKFTKSESFGNSPHGMTERNLNKFTLMIHSDIRRAA